MRGQIERRVWADGKTVTWTGRFAYEDPLTGERRHKRVSAPTRKLAEEKLRAAIAELDKGNTPRPAETPTLRAWSERWLASLAGRVRPQSAQRYADLLRLHALPTLGAIRLDRLAPDHLAALYAGRLAVGLSPTTVNRLHGTLAAMLKAAVLAGHLAASPTARVKPPRPARYEPAVWGAQEARQALAAAESAPYPALWRLALLCGLRRGELLGLKWEDVDLAAAVLRVRRTRSRTAAGGFQDGAPKSEAARRAVALPASCVVALDRHRAEQDAERSRLGELWEGTGHVFCGATGRPLHATSLQRAFDALIETSGLRPCRLHDLRHAAATLMLGAGVPIHTVSARLGHANAGITLRVYAHSVAADDEAAAGAMDALLAPTEPDEPLPAGARKTGSAPTARPRASGAVRKPRRQAVS